MSREKKMIKKDLFKVLNIAVILFSFITGPTVSAQSGAPLTATGREIGSVIQQQTQNMAMIMQQQMMMNMPRTDKVPSKFFPSCMVLPEKTSFPEGACAQPIPLGNPMALGQAKSYAQIAFGKKNEISDLLNKASNNPNPAEGIACLNKQSKMLGDKYQKKIDALQNYINQIEQNNEIFKEQNKALLSNMADLGYLLYGDEGNFQRKANTKHDKLKSSFTPQCQKLIGHNVLMGSKAGGLQGLNERTLSPASQDAYSVQANKSSYDNEIKKQIRKMVKDLKSKGPEVWNGKYSPSTGQTNFAAISGIVAEEHQEFLSSVDLIRKDLAGIFNLPRMDHNFKRNVVRYASNAEENLRKEYINACVTGADKTGMAISRDQLLKSLHYSRTNNRGSALNNYKVKLNAILDADGMIEDKVDLLKGLGESVTVSLKTYAGINTRVTPYELYIGQINLCKKRYERIDPKTKTSHQERIKEAGRRIKEALKVEQEYYSNLGKNIYEKVVNCSGAPLNEGSCTVGNSAKMFNTSSANFCLAHADQCSNDVISCQREAKAKIDAGKDQMAIMAEQYNTNLLALMEGQKMMFAAVQKDILGLTEMINHIVPGAAAEFPGGVFHIATPEPQLVAGLGVHLRGGGDLKSLRQLATNVAKLQDLLNNQRKKVLGEVRTHIAEQQQNIKDEESRWSNLAKQCQAVLTAYDQAAMEVNQKQAEAVNEANNFCVPYNHVQANPTCGGLAHLAESSVTAGQSLVGNAYHNAQRVRAQYCPSTSAESQDESENEEIDDEDAVRSLAKKCESNDYNFDKIKKELISSAMKNLPPHLANYQREIKKYLESDGEEKISEELEENSFFKDYYQALAYRLEDAASEKGLSAAQVAQIREVMGDDTPEDIPSEENVDFPEANYCHHMLAVAAEYEKEKDGNKYKDVLKGEEENKEFRKIARSIASVDSPPSVTSSANGYMGEISQELAKTPCTNVAGVGQRNTNPFAANAAEILGGDTRGLIFAQ